MFLARVVGNVWSTVKWPQIDGLKLLAVRPYHVSELRGELSANPPSTTPELVICADHLGAGLGEDVVVAYGHAARVALHEQLPEDCNPEVPVDAAVVAIVDRFETFSVGDILCAGSK